MVTCVVGSGVECRLGSAVEERLAAVMVMGSGDSDLSGLGIRVDGRRWIVRRMISHCPVESKTS
jgi:hypothetical protein